MADFCDSGVGVDEVDKSLEVEIYPNPNTDGIVQFTNPRPLLVTVRDVRGRSLINNWKVGKWLLELSE